MYAILLVSTMLQFAAAFLALRLIPLTGRNWSWTIISIGIFGMAARRLYSLKDVLLGERIPRMDFELVGLFVSAALFLGLLMLIPLFRTLKQGRDELTECERRFRIVADTTRAWEYWQARDGSFAYMSPACERITGYTRDEFMADPGLLERIVHPDDRETVSRHFALEGEDRDPGYLDFRIRARDGSEHWLVHHCTPVHDENGVYAGIRASNRIIDTRKCTEEALRTSRREYQDLVEQALCVVLRMDTSGRISFINGYGANLFGYAAEELLGRHVVGTILPSEDRNGQQSEQTVGSLISEMQGPAFTESECMRKDGSRIWLSWAHSSLRNANGETSEFLSVGLDVTACKAAEAFREDVTRIVRHDLKSPLAGIISVPKAMRDDENLTSEQRELLNAVEETGLRMMNMINSSLNLYKMEAGQYEFQAEPVDLIAVAAKAGKDVQKLRTRKVPVRILLNGRPIRENDSMKVPGEPNLLQNMAENLLLNAVEASDNQPVEIGFETDGKCVMEIRNKLAVPREICDNFFEKYATSGKSGGTGLGTYSAWLTARVHGGAIAMTTSEETGTCVRVTLPCAKA